MDRTVIPNGTQAEHPDARQRFNAFCQHPEVTLVYVTGRHKSLVQQAIKNYSLPEPNYAITDVGSKIYQVKQGKWTELIAWQQEIATSWRGKSHADLKSWLNNISGLSIQESHKQNSHKLSYYLPLYADKEQVMDTITARLKKEGVEASVIWSVDEPKNVGLLDVLPSKATKLHAIEFLQQELGYRHEETIFAGDSGNDMPVLRSAMQSILVANASAEIKKIALQYVEEAGYQSSLYLASPQHCGMNANYAAGVLEGVAYFAPQFQDLLKE
tara:strand:- start:569 stop:1381 length:813 start_codon:yes stop_codon:yes gene_type:complete